MREAKIARTPGCRSVIERLQLAMLSIRPLPGFTAWIDGLKDEMVRGVVLARIKRLERGLMGDVLPVGDGVSELRIHLGAGWRIYFTQRGKEIIVLLAGGSKRTQKADIKRAKVLAGLLDGEESDHE
jgi:putative addiction module killer protein